mmetsp:Transcript_65813/g.59092  ORF Transcript_65813/g.59092 Transcript_65813/m.59092 type:complete len:263 (+) Transcript_65813:129-917(+)
MINLSIAMLLLSFNIPQCLSIAPLTYSQADSKTRYANLVTYIVDYPWCLSAGYAANGDSHNLKANEHNLYWCHNYQGPDENNNWYSEDCNCLGLKYEHPGSQSISYIIDSTTYIIERQTIGGQGNEIQKYEHNLKADVAGHGNPDDFYWHGDNGELKLCHSWMESIDDEGIPQKRHCCIEWDQNVEMYTDIIDGLSKYGREAKCDGNHPIPGGRSANGDVVYFKYSGGTTVRGDLVIGDPTARITTKPPIGLPHPEGKDMLF